jgi:hypothetical protein
MAAAVYIQAWLAPENQWVFKGLPAEIPTIHGQGSIGPALSVRAHGEDERKARYDSASRTAIIRVGSLTWTVRDQAAADSMRDAWRHIAELGPIILGRQAPVDRRRRPSLDDPEIRHDLATLAEAGKLLAAVGVPQLDTTTLPAGHPLRRPADTRSTPTVRIAQCLCTDFAYDLITVRLEVRSGGGEPVQTGRRPAVQPRVWVAASVVVWSFWPATTGRTDPHFPSVPGWRGVGAKP